MHNRRGALRPLPIWARWLLSILVAGALLAGLLVAVHRAGPEVSSSEAQAEAETNRIADVAIGEDEAPRSAAPAAGLSPAAALERAIAGDVRGRIGGGQLTGPLQSVACRAAGGPRGGRAPYRCTVRSASVAYLFLAVVDDAQRRLTWCKVDPPAAAHAGPEVLISGRCTASG